MVISCSEMHVRTEGTSWLHLLACSSRLRHLHGHHASSNQRITKGGNQRLDSTVIQRARDKCLAFESSQASPDAHQPPAPALIDREPFVKHLYGDFPVEPDFTE